MAEPLLTLVVQSHRSPLPAPWYRLCLDSVRDWSARSGFDYRFLGDELFAFLSPALRRKTAGSVVIASDLARLEILLAALEEGYQRVVWMDADVLVFASERLRLPAGGAAFGRELWVEPDGRGGYRAHRKIHNAVMAFTAGDPVLPFYRFAAERILSRHQGPLAPQLLGPKLLSLLHNAIQFDVIEAAGMLSPVLVRALTGQGDDAALALFRRKIEVVPAALNLCGSLADDDVQMSALIERLLSHPRLLSPQATGDAPASGPGT